MTNPTDLDALLTDAECFELLRTDQRGSMHTVAVRIRAVLAKSPLVARLHEAEQARDDWRLITDGAKHDPRCPFNETDVGPRQAWPCLRCQMQAAEAREAALREALERERESHRICTAGQAYLLDLLNAVEANTPLDRPYDSVANVGPERGDSGQLLHRNGFQFICEWRCPQCSQSEVAGHLASCCRLATPPTRSQS
jgi:hypothetical protein